jgi:hypothetical protein
MWNTAAFDGALTVRMVICDVAYDPGDYMFDWNDLLLMSRP